MNPIPSLKSFAIATYADLGISPGQQLEAAQFAVEFGQIILCLQERLAAKHGGDLAGKFVVAALATYLKGKTMAEQSFLIDGEDDGYEFEQKWHERL
jgi:hypothetical protein